MQRPAIDPTPFDVVGDMADEATFFDEAPSLLFDGTKVWVFWSSNRSGTVDMPWARPITAGTPPTLGGWTQLTQEGVGDRNPAAVRQSTGSTSQIWVFWESSRRGPTDIWAVTGTGDGASWSNTPVRITAGNQRDRTPCAVDDASNTLRLYYSEETGDGCKIRQAVPPTAASSPWTFSDVTTSTPSVRDESPTAVVSGSTVWLYWHSNRTSVGQTAQRFRIWSATSTASGFTPPSVAIARLSNDQQPAALMDGASTLHLYFASQQTGARFVSRTVDASVPPATGSTQIANELALKSMGAFVDRLHYTYQTGVTTSATVAGLGRPVVYARDTVGIFLQPTPGTTDAQNLVTAARVRALVTLVSSPFQVKLVWYVEQSTGAFCDALRRCGEQPPDTKARNSDDDEGQRFSQAPSDALAAAVAKNYVAVHVEQGIPVLDRDLNLLGDLIAAALQQALKAHVGTGVAGTSDFSIVTNGNANDFRITAGTRPSSTAGRSSSAANASYTALAAAGSLPALTTPTSTQPNPRIDTVYLDVWQGEIDDSPSPAGDPLLGNTADVGIRTSTRIQTSFAVRVAEGASSAPAPGAGHYFYTLATLSRATGAAVPGSATPASNTIADARQQAGLNLGSLFTRLTTLEGLLAPTISSYGPQIVVAGQSSPVTILGKNFLLGNVTVSFGTVPGTIDWTTTTNTSLVVAVPYAAATGAADVTLPLTVGNELGSATATPLITVIPAAPLAFTTTTPFTPARRPPDRPSRSTAPISVGVNRVSFNTSPPVTVVPNSVSATAISVVVPSSLPAGATMTITVFINGLPSATATSPTTFTVDSPTPAPTPPLFAAPGAQIAPETQTKGNSVTLKGTSFGTSSLTTTVTFNGTPAVVAPASSLTVTATSIQVTVPTTLVVPASPNNKCTITVTVNGLSITSNDPLTVL